MARTGKTTTRRRGGLARLARLLILGPILLVLGYLLLCSLLLGLYRFVPPPITTVQIQRTVGMAVAPGNVQFSRSWRSADAISTHLPRAVVAAEDTRFFQHGGIDWEELEKVRAEARRRGRPPARGASTITQQLVKNLFLTTHRSYVRKAFEYPLAYAAEFMLPKDRILELYVNVVEWGPGVYGAEAAARYHYRVSAADLTREQSARLAAVLPAPRSRTPQSQNTYSSIIQQRMRQMGW
jgi:monofunctional glycosyltransferase